MQFKWPIDNGPIQIKYIVHLFSYNLEGGMLLHTRIQNIYDKPFKQDLMQQTAH